MSLESNFSSDLNLSHKQGCLDAIWTRMLKIAGRGCFDAFEIAKASAYTADSNATWRILS